MHELYFCRNEVEEDIGLLEVYSTLSQLVVLLKRELQWCPEVLKEEVDLTATGLQQ
jgi:hypothetical protein